MLKSVASRAACFMETLCTELLHPPYILFSEQKFLGRSLFSLKLRAAVGVAECVQLVWPIIPERVEGSRVPRGSLVSRPSFSQEC